MQHIYKLKVSTNFLPNIVFIEKLLTPFKKVILPKRIKKFVVIKSPHINNASKEHFKIVKYQRLFFVKMSLNSLKFFLQKTSNSVNILIKK